MKTIKYALLLLALAGTAHAAKVKVSWTNPSTNTDGSALTNLSYIEIEWGTCNGTAFGIKQASMLVVTSAAGAAMTGFVYPTGLTQVCIRAFAVNAPGAKSAYSNVAVKSLLPKPGKPVTLDQPVILSFNQE